MNHIDEGTLHAWIDGALDAAQTRDVEAHLASCSACSAAAAEARGLVAASSRILSALDDVPAGVIPRSADASRAASRVTRQWRAAPWVTGIAAALMLAIGVRQWNRGESPRTLPERTSTAAEQVPASPTPTPTPPAPATAPAATPTTQTQTPRVATEANRVAAGAGASEPLGKSVAPSARPAPGVAAATERRQLRLDEVVVTGVSEPVSSDAARRADRRETMAFGARDRAAAIVAPDTPRPAATPDGVLAAIVGCYQVPRIAIAKGRAGVAAPSRAQMDVAAAAADTRRTIRLDSLVQSSGFVVRDSVDNVIGWWVPAGDTVRVDVIQLGAFTLARTDRRPCPQR